MQMIPAQRSGRFEQFVRSERRREMDLERKYRQSSIQKCNTFGTLPGFRRPSKLNVGRKSSMVMRKTLQLFGCSSVDDCRFGRQWAMAQAAPRGGLRPKSLSTRCSGISRTGEKDAYSRRSSRRSDCSTERHGEVDSSAWVAIRYWLTPHKRQSESGNSRPPRPKPPNWCNSPLTAVIRPNGPDRDLFQRPGLKQNPIWTLHK